MVANCTPFYICFNHMAFCSAGKTVPSMETGSIPSVSKLPSQKRSRTMSRVGLPKRRKVLIDDAIVLHAEYVP